MEEFPRGLTEPYSTLPPPPLSRPFIVRIANAIFARLFRSHGLLRAELLRNLSTMSAENVTTNIVNEAEPAYEAAAKDEPEVKPEATVKVAEEKPAESEELKEPEKMEEVSVVREP